MRKARLLILQSGGPTAVVNATLAGVLESAAASNKIIQIYGAKNGIKGLLEEQFVELDNLSERTLSELKELPGAVLGTSRHSYEDPSHVIKILKKHNIDNMICIGGNGTMRFCHNLQSYVSSKGVDLAIVGVPKTIDNDIPLTDHTPGYGSAARFIATVTRDIGLDQQSVRSYHDVTLLEVLGRDTGWIAAATAFTKLKEADAPHIILFPEVSFDKRRFLDRLFEIHNKLGCVFVVACEGIKLSNPNQPDGFIGLHEFGVKQNKDPWGQISFAQTHGIGLYLSQLIQAHSELKVRWLRPGLIMRACTSSVSNVDRQEAYLTGRAAVDQGVNKGLSGVMIGIRRISSDPYHTRFDTLSLTNIAENLKSLPAEFIDDSSYMTTQAFLNYLRPLIGEPTVSSLNYPTFEDV